MTKQAPEIYQKSVEDIDLSGLPPRGTADFDQAIITRYALEYAARGWNAVVTVDDQYVRVVAVPEQGIEPKTYVIGLLKHGYLEDALPILEARQKSANLCCLRFSIDLRWRYIRSSVIA